jgi:hypothetical protein
LGLAVDDIDEMRAERGREGEGRDEGNGKRLTLVQITVPPYPPPISPWDSLPAATQVGSSIHTDLRSRHYCVLDGSVGNKLELEARFPAL